MVFRQIKLPLICKPRVRPRRVSTSARTKPTPWSIIYVHIYTIASVKIGGRMAPQGGISRTVHDLLYVHRDVGPTPTGETVPCASSDPDVSLILWTSHEADTGKVGNAKHCSNMSG